MNTLERSVACLCLFKCQRQTVQQKDSLTKKMSVSPLMFSCSSTFFFFSLHRSLLWSATKAFMWTLFWWATICTAVFGTVRVTTWTILQGSMKSSLPSWRKWRRESAKSRMLQQLSNAKRLMMMAPSHQTKITKRNRMPLLPAKMRQVKRKTIELS